MSIIRDVGVTLTALQDRVFITCSDPMSTAGSTSPVGIRGSATTADAVAAGSVETTAFGNIIDRLSAPLGQLYTVAMPSAQLFSTRGSTEANRQITLGVKLQHGDSSGGGDLADFSTASQPDSRTYFSTVRSSDHRSWDASISTGVLNAVSPPAYYDLRAAKRYLRVAVPVFKNRITTESSGDEQSRLSARVTFLGAGHAPEARVFGSFSPYSTSTST